MGAHTLTGIETVAAFDSLPADEEYIVGCDRTNLYILIK